MMFGPNANSRVGATSNESLFHLLKRPWDPFVSSLVQTRPRKLPGNPIVVIVPSSPSISNPNQLKRQHKWITLLSNLCTVVAVHTNMGSSANRLTMINCADQMLAATRAKIQEVKADYPGRPIILIGFNVGSALALQVAQVEHVLCVVCLGFSLLTAEGKRGEPDDSLLELQCPVLFVIGQCSNTASQQDIEDLRERMRVENGLIVVGFADDYLRVNKKKKRAEGITQAGIDRSVVDHIGEVISSLLLSPFPPQLRQSPHGSSEVPLSKRPKIERRRNNSNGSSIDSEPPSPTPKISRPVGRPPGSKGKAKLQAKWAAQVNQGISVSSPDTSTPSLSSSLSHSDTNSNKITKNNDVQPSTTVNNSADSHNNIVTSTAKMRMRAMGLNRSVLTSGTLAHLLQNGGKGNMTAPQPTQTTSSSIKVLENVTLTTNATAKLIAGTNRSFSSNSKSSPVMIMPDGKLKSFGNSVRGTGSTPIVLPMTNKKLLTHTTHPGHRLTKYITSKKQLSDQRPPVSGVKSNVISSFSTNLPPPTNLTSQDIMDLPIIFADDNQMLTDNSKLHTSDVSVSEIVHPHAIQKNIVSNPVGKFVFINKQIPITSTVLPTHIVQPTTTLKRPTLTVPLRTMNPLKYAKIVLSNPVSRSSVVEPKLLPPPQVPVEPKTTPQDAEVVPSPVNILTTISTLPDISVSKVEANPPTTSATLVDVENAIISTAIKKPDYQITQIKDKPEPSSEVSTPAPSTACVEASASEEAPGGTPQCDTIELD
ncbi:zinc finger protein jing homolog isoform X1 [Photinus pyralis]|uniref:zinc finger protein jing homolog isoform X1 n=1 Tax=Photinus pyralis TaxID=7054 RepID=UPI00126712C2|nr:zinc finger protein jing homolog isoform X1 [Photinus pyralis]